MPSSQIAASYAFLVNSHPSTLIHSSCRSNSQIGLFSSCHVLESVLDPLNTIPHLIKLTLLCNEEMQDFQHCSPSPKSHVSLVANRT